MLFRSPDDTPIRLALLSGHTAVVGPKWRALPGIFHYAAMTGGCERDDNRKVPTPVGVEADPGAMNRVPDVDDKYRAALITMLTRDEPGDFTAASLPNVNVVSKLVGFAARKEDVLRVFKLMKEAATDGAGASETGSEADV